MSTEMASWLRHYFPAIRPSGGWGGDPCWIAFMMTRNPEHNPPFYWLGRAFDVVEEGGADDVVRSRLFAAHGEDSCGGDPTLDEAAQDVLTEVCGYAWAVAHLGPARFERTVDGPSLERDAVQLHVPAHDAYVAPARLRPCRTLQELADAVRGHAEITARRLPPASGRILYLDTWHDPRYAQGVGYRLELTEPLQQAVRHFTAEHELGHVLTRPFQWGNAIEAWY